MNIPISEFYDPLNSRFSNKKTLNNSYLKLILKSKKFRDDSLEYLESGLLQVDYKTLIERKIKQLISRFSNLENCKDDEKLKVLIKKMIKYFRTNR